MGRGTRLAALPDREDQVMADALRCPMCANGEVSRAEGRLDQSGATYLPTTVWSCCTCGYTRYEPALGAAWRSSIEQAAAAQVAVASAGRVTTLR
jgi:hypothetical protein